MATDDAVIDRVLDWERQQRDFEEDGSLRDVYVLDTTIEDWGRLIDALSTGPYPMTAFKDGQRYELTPELRDVFGDEHRYNIEIQVQATVVRCFFFVASEIEFSFAVNGFTVEHLRDILRFVIFVGDAVGRPTVLTPESLQDHPIFSYEPEQRYLAYVDSVEA